MALKLTKNLILKTSQIQPTRLSVNYFSKEINNLNNEPVEHKVVTYEKNQIKTVEKQTHTKQMWGEKDIRLVRYINKEKQINENFAIDLISDVPPIKCKDRVVSCNGGNGSLGHPRVFINLDQPGNHSCGYCGLRFYLDDHH